MEFTWKVPFRDLIQQVSTKYQLDPYLVAVHGEARLVLGIWDGERLIASA